MATMQRQPCEAWERPNYPEAERYAKQHDIPQIYPEVMFGSPPSCSEGSIRIQIHKRPTDRVIAMLNLLSKQGTILLLDMNWSHKISDFIIDIGSWSTELLDILDKEETSNTATHRGPGISTRTISIQKSIRGLLREQTNELYKLKYGTTFDEWEAAGYPLLKKEEQKNEDAMDLAPEER